MDIPVYLVAGFLDGGKTNFINGILEDGFARQDPTLLLCCEEGEEEYEKNALDNVTVITIEDEEDLKCSYLKELEKEYHPKQVLIEYNGMWQMERLYREVLPANWVLYQIMTFVQASTFEMYAKNMGQLMMEKIIKAHYPDLDQKLIDGVLDAFYRVRDLRGLQKKPSTSEVLDWIQALVIGGVPVEKLEKEIPFAGVLLKKTEDLKLVENNRYVY